MPHHSPKDASDPVFDVVWEGPFDSPTSFARVNRELLTRLQARAPGHYSRIDTASSSSDPLPDATPPDIWVSHGIPERLQAPTTPSKWVAILPWDYGLAPRQRVQRAREMDEIWVPSQFCAESYLRAGVPPAQLRVIPNGVDTRVYSPEGPARDLPTRKSLRLLYIGGSLHRKGVDLLLAAYLEAFGPTDDVCLIIKDQGTRGQYAASSLYAEICASTGHSDQAEVLIYDDSFWTDAELSALYRACNVYVQPYRGEGFALPILEAMACGLPAVIPAGGPAPEFCPPSASWQLPVNPHFLRRMAFADPSYIKEDTDLPSFYLEVQPQALIDCLQALPQQRDLCLQKGQAARTAALTYDWDLIADQVAQRLRELADGQAPQRLQPRPELATLLDAAQSAWKQGNLSQTQALLAQALEEGLSLEAAWAAPAWAPRWRPPRIWLEPGLLGADHVPPDWRAEGEADLALSSGKTWPSEAIPRILWLQQPPQGDLPESTHCWSAERSWARGFKGPVWLLPEALDFRFFHPCLPQQPHLLSVSRWVSGAWRELLQALSRPGPEHRLLELVLVPLGTPLAQAQREVEHWLQAHSLDLSVRLREAPADVSARRELYRHAVGFIDSDPESDGRWHLQAQAMGIPCLGTGQRDFLQPPWARVLTSPADWAAGLGYLLGDQRADYDGLAIREHLQTRHDLPVIKAQIAQHLGRFWLFQCLQNA